MFERMLRWAVPVGMLALGVACTGPAQPEGPGSPAASEGPVTPKANRLVVAMSAPSAEGNSPFRDYSAPPIVQLRPMYENLLAISTKDGKYEPQLATTWNVEPDGKSYRFKLRSGVQFHHGYGEMKAQDVEFTTWDLTQEDSVHSNAPFFRNLIDRIQIVNDYELVYWLKEPNAEFLSNMSQQISGMEIHSKAAFEKEGKPTMQTRPTPATGAYQFKERQQGAFVRFERVPYQHWRVTPDFPELELRWVNEASTRLAGLLTGEIHMTPLSDDLMAQAERQGMKVAKGTIPGVRIFLPIRCCYLNDIKDPSKGYKFPNSPLMDVRVRRALSKAINRDELNRTLFRGKGELMILNHFHPTRQGWNPDWEKRFPEEYGYDPARARALLQEAGYGPTNPLRTNVLLVTLAETPQSQDVQEAIAGYWRAIGVEVNLLSIDRAEVSRRDRALEFDNHISIMTAPSNQILGVRVYNTYTVANRGTKVEIPEVDDLFNKKVQVELDERRQEEVWRELGEALFRHHQIIPLYWLPVEVMYDPKIVASWEFPGSISGLYSNLETVKAAR